MKRFVIHKHKRQGQATHWDLMLENNGLLETYRLSVPPEDLADNKYSVVKIADHNVKFLTYQGPVNQGQGSVKIADEGFYTTIDEADTHKTVELVGNIFNGKLIIPNE